VTVGYSSRSEFKYGFQRVVVVTVWCYDRTMRSDIWVQRLVTVTVGCFSRTLNSDKG